MKLFYWYKVGDGLWTGPAVENIISSNGQCQNKCAVVGADINLRSL